MAGLRTLITGGAGFIGSHLGEHLLGQGHDVVALDDLSTGGRENVQHLMAAHRFRLVVDTVTHQPVLDRLVQDADTVYHLAAVVGVQAVINSPIHTIETNIMGTAAVLRACSRLRRRLVLASTSEIYGKSERVPFSEEDDRLLGPTSRSRWSYSESKAVDEFLAYAYYKEAQLPVVIVRLFNTIGPRQSGRYGMVVPRMVGQALAGQPITVYGDGRQTRCFADVRDVVRGMVALSACPGAYGQAFNLGSTREITILDLARLIKSLLDSPSEIVLVPYAEAYDDGFEDTLRRVPDVSKVSAAIGWQSTTPLEETILNVASFLRCRPGNP